MDYSEHAFMFPNLCLNAPFFAMTLAVQYTVVDNNVAVNFGIEVRKRHQQTMTFRRCH